MGNKAVITTKDKKIGLYLHWNGGRDSVEAFLEYCKIKDYRAPSEDCYGWARLTQVIGNFFGGSASVGIDSYDTLDTDNCDNGVYIIEGWEIVGREFNRRSEQCEFELTDMLIEINERQPETEQIDSRYFISKQKDTKDIVVGDMVFEQDFTGKYELLEIIGLGRNTVLNGHRVKDLPYTSRYSVDNCNAYLLKKNYRVIEQLNPISDLSVLYPF